MTCRLDDCDRAVHADGWCKTHYLRVYRYGTPTPVTARLDPIGHFWSQIERKGPEDCWVWTSPGRSGTHQEYGMVGARAGLTPSGTRLPHRIAYELTHGVTLAPETPLDHLCRNTLCANPAHLEPVTTQENVRRGKNGVLRTHCRRNHELTPENTYVRPSDNARKCRICSRDDARAKRATERTLSGVSI